MGFKSRNIGSNPVTNLPQVHRIDVGAVAYQQLGDLKVAVGARIMQRHEAKIAYGLWMRGGRE